jgi:hypothetical protein
MESLNSLRNENKSKIKRTIMEELEAEYQTVLLTIRLMDQITSKQWSSHVRERV